jgi:hypothetical protein
MLNHLHAHFSQELAAYQPIMWWPRPSDLHGQTQIAKDFLKTKKM